MVIDARGPNLCHHRPPKARLGTPAALSEIDFDWAADLAEAGGIYEIDAHYTGADIKDCFHQFLCPEVGSWFCLPDVFSAADLGVSETWCDEARRVVPLAPDDQVYVCIEAMPMGWSWALYFAQEAVSEIAAATNPRGFDGLLRDRCPAPVPLHRAPIHSVYVDNFTAIAVDATDADLSHKAFAKGCTDAGLVAHEEVVATQFMETLGLVRQGGGRPGKAV